MTLFTLDVGQNTVHVFDADAKNGEGIFYPKLPEEDLLELNIPNLKRGDCLVIEDAHLRERVEGGRSVAHAFTYNQLIKLFDNALKLGITIKLFPQKKTPAARTLAGYDNSLKKKNSQFMEKYGISTDEADVRSIALFLKKNPEAFRRLKTFMPQKEEDYRKENEHVFEYIQEANEDINIARTQGYGFDDWYNFDDAPHRFIENQKYELCDRLMGDGIFNLDQDNEFTGEELMKSIGLSYKKRGTGLNKIDKVNRLYTLVSSILRSEPNEDVEDDSLKDLRLRGFPPNHKYYGKKMFPNWKFIKANYFALKPFHMKGGVAASNYKQHMRPALSNFEGKLLPLNITDEMYSEFKSERSKADRMMRQIWRVLYQMIVKDGLR